MEDKYQQLLPEIIRLAQKTGDRILKYFDSPAEKLKVAEKADHTLLITADLEAHEKIFEGLTRLSPETPILSEEGDIPNYDTRRQWPCYWLVDPLDGSRGFIDHCPEFTVNIALVKEDRPVLGVVYLPTKQLCYFAIQNQGAFKSLRAPSFKPTPLRVRPMSDASISILLGRYLKSEVLLDLSAALKGSRIIRLNSSLKFCWIAEGRADCYPRLGDTYEWDTAAGQCVLEEAGGLVVDLHGKPLQYNVKQSLINPAFLAMGDHNKKDKLIQLLTQLPEGDSS